MTKLETGYLSYTDLSIWFGSKSPKTFLHTKQLKINKLIELKHYAEFTILENGIDITSVKIPYYLKRNKSRDRIYSSAINKALPKLYTTEQEIINTVLASDNEKIKDDPEVVKWYIKDLLQDYPQYIVFGDEDGNLLTEEEQAYFQSVQYENGPESSEGMSAKAYNFLVGRAQTIARYSFMDKYKFAPVELGVHYERTKF